VEAVSDNDRAIACGQPHRIVPDRPRSGRGRAWPCGRHDGGWLYGPGDECRAADVVIEDKVGPPNYVSYAGGYKRVESTQFETRLTARTDKGIEVPYFTWTHPRGLASTGVVDEL
jgi:hypothetical protein